MSTLNRRSFISLTAGSTAALAAKRYAWAQPRAARDLTRLTLHEASALLQRRDVSPVELTQACLARIEQHDAKVNAFITLTAKSALDQARVAEAEILRGEWRGPLHGIPLALKDNIDTAGIRTTAASAVFIDRVPTADAEVVQRLKQAGAVLLGKLNMTEFALWLQPVSYWGAASNPWGLEYESGGSSSGSAAAVAAGFCFGTLGTDTGGSIRMPAHCCGVVGLKPTHGVVSNRGIIPALDLLDHVGPLGKSVLDVALLLQGIAGYDPQWVHSRASEGDYAAVVRKGLDAPRIAVPKSNFLERLDPEVSQLFTAALRVVESIAPVVDDNVIIPTHYEPSLDAEFWAYHQPLFEKRSGLYQPSSRKVLDGLQKNPPSAVGYVNALQALQAKRREASQLFRDGVEFLVLPTWKHSPMKIVERQQQLLRPSEEVSPELYNTDAFNALGLPAISVPCGFTPSGLPAGLQIVGKPFGDAKVLALAQAYESATKWHLSHAKL